jgi:hypothetical protein
LRPTGICFLLDKNGLGLARSPEPRNPIVGKKWGWRDYQQGAQLLGTKGVHATYVSRAFEAGSDGNYAFGLSTPVFAADGTWIGVLMTTVMSGRPKDALQFNEPSDSSRTATLVALLDRAHPDAPLPPGDDFRVLVHERLAAGKTVKLPLEVARLLAQLLPEPSRYGPEQFQSTASLSEELANYQDPVPGEPGTWVAAFAPVGRTGMAVIVQIPEKAVLAVNAQLGRRIVTWSVPFAVCAGLFWALLGWSRYRLLK